MKYKCQDMFEPRSVWLQTLNYLLLYSGHCESLAMSMSTSTVEWGETERKAQFKKKS